MKKVTGIAATRAEAHLLVKRGYALAVELVEQGKQAYIKVEEAEDVRSIQQNRFYWGPMLGDIAEQAMLDNVRYSKDCWHEYGKRNFLPRKIKRVRVAGRPRPVVTRSLGSTKDLSVAKFSKYIEKFMAWAVTDLGVRFTEHRWEDYRGD